MPVRLLVKLLMILLPGSTLIAQADTIGNDVIFPGHPRILWLKGEEQSVLKNISSDTAWQNLHQAILAACDKLLPAAPVERIKIGRRLLDKSREALRRILYLSYAFRATHQQPYAQRAEKEMLAISAFTDWNPTHFLDVAEMTTALAIGYDWLFDYLQPASRALIRTAIVEKGILPSLDSNYNRNWLKAEHNWNQVCHTGMAYGAMAVYEDRPALAKQIINRSILNLPYAMKAYAPDGIYPEGYGYWGYGTSFNVLLLAALDKLCGRDFGLTNMPGFLKTAGFLEQMTGPGGKPFNYADAGMEAGPEPAMYWFAGKIKDPSVLWVERSRLLQHPLAAFTGDRLLPCILLWNNGINLNNIAAPASGYWMGHGINPVALMRSSWTDANAVYVAMKGGSAAINHAHMDAGSFIMDAQGERWAMDFGRQEYESLESKGLQIFGRTQDAQRWTVFRYVNQVHNTLTINDQHQRVNGNAPLIAASSGTAFMHAILDLTEVYKGQLTKALRGIGIRDKKYVVVRDEIMAADTVTTIRWTLLTPAHVTITGRQRMMLEQHGKRLFLQAEAPGAAIMMKTWSTDPPHDYDAPNAGTTLAGFEITIPAKSAIAINVLLTPGEAAAVDLKTIGPLNTWPHD